MSRYTFGIICTRTLTVDAESEEQAQAYAEATANTLARRGALTVEEVSLEETKPLP